MGGEGGRGEEGGREEQRAGRKEGGRERETEGERERTIHTYMYMALENRKWLTITIPGFP